MAYITLENISEIIIEDILIKYSKNNKIEALVTSNNKSNSLIDRIDNTNKGFLINLTEPNTKKVKKSKASIFKKYKILVNSKNSNNKKTKDKGNSNYNKGSQTSIKIPVITRKYIVLSSSYYIKY
jgi:TRAP-type uncharacterized transport system substrate-binding protein